MLLPMNLPDLRPLAHRGVFSGWWGPRSRAGTVAGVVLSLLAGACTQAGLVEAEAPVTRVGTRQLELVQARPLGSELLHASVEVFGIEIATLDSSFCREPDGGAVAATQVEAASLVKIIRKTSGEGPTRLPEPGRLPSSSDYTFRDGDLVRHYGVDYRPGSYSYVYDNGGVERRTGTDDVPQGASAHDMHSAMLLLRGWRPRLDEKAYFYAVLGRRPWRVDVTSRGVEMIKMGDDARLTYRIDGVAVRLWQPESAQPKHFSVWLSEEADRVPLRMVADASFGQVTMSLTGRESGAQSCSPPAVAAAEAPGPRPAVPVAPAGAIGKAWSSGPVERRADAPEPR
jgi:Protein of unknown function (DUF3108)